MDLVTAGQLEDLVSWAQTSMQHCGEHGLDASIVSIVVMVTMQQRWDLKHESTVKDSCSSAGRLSLYYLRKLQSSLPRDTDWLLPECLDTSMKKQTIENIFNESFCQN